METDRSAPIDAATETVDTSFEALRLAVVIVNYETAALVIDCLGSLVDELEAGRDRAIVVDNASRDGSAEAIGNAIADNAWADRVGLVRSPRNGGFSSGHNLGLRNVRAEFYLLLNSDTRVGKGALPALLEAARTHPEAALIGPCLLDPDGAPQYSAFRARTPLGEFLEAADTGALDRWLRRWHVLLPQSAAPRYVDWISFACVLLRRAALDEIGPLDEGYFMYFEDVDYCRSARRRGWRVLQWPAARVVHLEGGSSLVPGARQRRERPPAYYYASRSRYFAKAYGRAGLCAANLLWHLGRTISLLREWIQGKEAAACEHEWRDIWRGALRPVSEANGPSIP